MQMTASSALSRTATVLPKRPAVTAKCPFNSPDNTYKVKLTLLQTSDSNSYFSGMVDLDRDTGNGLFPILIKDLKGGLVFSTEAAWCVKKAPVTRGKETNNREWELDTGDAP